MNEPLKKIFLSLLLGVYSLYGTEKKPFSITPQEEYEKLLACAQQPSSSLSESLQQLIVDISDHYYTEAFFKKLSDAEAAKFDGEYVDYWENGQLKIKAPLKKGVVDGHVHGWYPDGKESFKAYYDAGKKIGIHMAFVPLELSRHKFQSTIARYLIFNREGKLDGHQFSEYPSGKLKVTADFRNGMLDGNKSFYTEEGKTLEDQTYKKNKLITKPKKKRFSL